MSQPTVFFQPGATIAGSQAASITSLIESRTADESHIVATAFAVNNLIASRTVDEANIATLTNSSTNQLTAINSLIASRTIDEATIAQLGMSTAANTTNIASMVLSKVADEVSIASIALSVANLTAALNIDVNCYQSVVARTTANLSLATSGIGPGHTVTMTSSSNYPAEFDGVILRPGDRVLLANQTRSQDNGIYVAQTGFGVIGQSWILARANDANTTAQMITGATVLVTGGHTYASTRWSLQGPFTVFAVDGTPAIYFDDPRGGIWQQYNGVRNWLDTALFQSLGPISQIAYTTAQCDALVIGIPLLSTITDAQRAQVMANAAASNPGAQVWVKFSTDVAATQSAIASLTASIASLTAILNANAGQVITSSVITGSVNIGAWSIQESGPHLLFKHNDGQGLAVRCDSESFAMKDGNKRLIHE